MAAACNADTVDGWRWIFRILLVFAALLLIGFAVAYFVRCASFSGVRTELTSIRLTASAAHSHRRNLAPEDEDARLDRLHSASRRCYSALDGFRVVFGPKLRLARCPFLRRRRGRLCRLGPLCHMGYVSHPCLLTKEVLTIPKTLRMEGHINRLPRPPPLPARPQLPAVHVLDRGRRLALLPRQQHLRTSGFAVKRNPLLIWFLLSVRQAAEVNAVWGHPGDLKTTARIAPFYLLGIVACPVTAWCESCLLHPEGSTDRELIKTSSDVTKAKDVKWPTAFAFFCFSLAFLGFALSGENAGMATAL